MPGVTVLELANAYPRLYHMAGAGSWPSIQTHGLLSTTSLLDLFGVIGERRISLEERHRPTSVVIRHKNHGSAVVRDQKPMSDEGLVRALGGKLTPRDWYVLLNRRVFFWVTPARLRTLMDARAYKDLRKTILVLDTRLVLLAHAPAVLLCPMNSGATKPMPHPRGSSTFLPLSSYPFEDRRSAGKEAVVELTVEGGVQNVSRLALRVEEVGGGSPPRVLVGSGPSEFGG